MTDDDLDRHLRDILDARAWSGIAAARDRLRVAIDAALIAALTRINTPGQLVVRVGDTVTTYPFAQRVPCEEGLEFRCRTYDVQEPHREWYEERVAELEAGIRDADDAIDAYIDIIEAVVNEDAAPLIAVRMREKIAAMMKGAPHE